MGANQCWGKCGVVSVGGGVQSVCTPVSVSVAGGPSKRGGAGMIGIVRGWDSASVGVA